MIIGDEFLALRSLIGRPLAVVADEPIGLTYSRAYRLTRALLDPGPGRLAVRGRFTRIVDQLSSVDQVALHNRLAAPDPKMLSIIDPRPAIRTAGTVQNAYSVSLLQAETLAVAVLDNLRIVFADPDSASAPFRRAATEMGLDLEIVR